MRIRLQSIEGRVGNPLYNEERIEEAIEKAIKDKIGLIVFPANSIATGYMNEVEENSTYGKAVCEAERALELFIDTERYRQPGFPIVYIGVKRLNFDSAECPSITIASNPSLQTIEGLFTIENRYRRIAEETESDLFVVCQGRGTESVCDGVCLNTKMVFYKGKLVASNRLTNEDVLDCEIDEAPSRYPYLDEIDDTDRMFEDILEAQTYALHKKMLSMGRDKICLGVSGGLDSTVSLLVCAEAFKRYGMSLKNIIGVTMPGLGTTKRTYENSKALMKKAGVTLEEIDLKPLLKMHLKNISQPEGKYDVTFEQTQSRERTQVLLDIANRDNAIMIGTGCMSEFALGWMSYGGDHLSMFAINVGLPKTVVKMYAKWLIERYKGTGIDKIVKDILEGPVSPELLPIDDKGEQHEKTESIIGDYAVQDFFIYHFSKAGETVREVFDLAVKAFPEYTPEKLIGWMEIFVLRFFTRAYKKNCSSDGLQIFSYSASPDSFHIPSDIDNAIWKAEVDKIKKELSAPRKDGAKKEEASE